MKLTLLEVTNLIANSMGIKADDSSNIALIRSYINEAYLMLCSVDKRVTKAYVPIINGIATIPNNSLGIVKCTPELSFRDKVYGKSIVTDKTGILEMLYYTTRDMVVQDEDEFDLHELLQQAIVSYVCSVIATKNGDTNIANNYNDLYMRNVSSFEQNDIAIPEYVVEVDY